MDLCKYLTEYNIHVIDYSSPVNMTEGLKHIEELEKYFAEHTKDVDTLKILIEAKGHIKENPETHDTLAKISRTKFAKKFSNINVFVAVLNDHHTFSVSEKEHWFMIREEAINWLLKQSA
jgi:hypothetical protein